MRVTITIEDATREMVEAIKAVLEWQAGAEVEQTRASVLTTTPEATTPATVAEELEATAPDIGHTMEEDPVVEVEAPVVEAPVVEAPVKRRGRPAKKEVVAPPAPAAKQAKMDLQDHDKPCTREELKECLDAARYRWGQESIVSVIRKTCGVDRAADIPVADYPRVRDAVQAYDPNATDETLDEVL